MSREEIILECQNVEAGLFVETLHQAGTEGDCSAVAVPGFADHHDAGVTNGLNDLIKIRIRIDRDGGL